MLFRSTSTCITNALDAALGVMAAGQCAMNNFTFGNNRFQYGRAISGGSGTGGITDAKGKVVSGFNGTSLVQAHMTNSRLTDPEILDFRFPVQLESYEIRTNSGDTGKWHCGEGGVLNVRFLEAMTASILSNGRKAGAFGVTSAGRAGGAKRGRVSDGRVETLAHISQAYIQPGDVFAMHRLGRGGFYCSGPMKF